MSLILSHDWSFVPISPHAAAGDEANASRIARAARVRTRRKATKNEENAQEGVGVR